MFSLVATFLTGLLIGWFVWGRLKHKVASLDIGWRNKYSDLENDYLGVVNKFNELELDFNKKSSHVRELNKEKNTLIGNLNSVKSTTLETDKEVEELKNQLGQITARCHVTSKELDKCRIELEALRGISDEAEELKALLGKATQRYNINGLELKNKTEELFIEKNINSETNKHIKSLNNELENLRAQLLRRDNEFEGQVVSYANLQNELNENNQLLKAAEEKLSKIKTGASDTQNLKHQEEKIKSLENQLANTAKQLKGSQTESAETKQQIPVLNSTINSLRERVPALENSLKQRDSSIVALEGEVQRLAKQLPQLRDQLDKRSSHAEELKQQVNTLQQKIPAFKSTIAARDAHIRELEIFIKEAQKAILKPANRSTVANGSHLYSNGAASGNGHRNGTSTNGTANRNGHSNGTNNVINFNGNGASKANGNGNGKHNGSVKQAETSKITRQKPHKRKIKSYGLKKPTRKPDDLKQISGVGEVLEKTLHKCGIYYFEQIAGFSRKDVSAVDEMLNFKGRIDREEWIKQAKLLKRGGTYEAKKPVKKSQPRKRRKKALGMKRPSGELDDLQLINGVGPKLERKLHRLGVYHYEQIAEFTAEDIELLDSKLKTYRGRVKRDKWPMQARKLHREFYT